MVAMSPTRSARLRLDELLVERGVVSTRARARALVMAGKVLVDGRPAVKAGHLCPRDCKLELRTPDHPYVSRGGVKLAGALDRFGIDVAGLVCADIGSSTGGFVDCLLQRGARRVFAVDTGNVLDQKIRSDSRVRYLANTNARYLREGQMAEPVQLLTIDLSFISVTKVIPVLIPLMADAGQLIVLVKPQFEAGRAEVGKGGVVRDVETTRRVLREICQCAHALRLSIRGLCESPIRGAEGNREFFLYLIHRPAHAMEIDPDAAIGSVLPVEE